MIIRIRSRGKACPVPRRTLCAWLVPVLACAVAAANPAAAGPPLRFTAAWHVWPGVSIRAFVALGASGPAVGELLGIDLRDRRVSLGLLHPRVVAAREQVSKMADAQHAVAGINGDFFNISETRPGVPATGSSVGPEIADGRDLKAAVPDGQRFGPPPPAGTTAETVFGVGSDRVARISTLHLTGTVRGSGETITLRGLNQYALPVGGVGAFTSAWGPVSRLRAVCGTDLVRGAPCSTDVAEATVRHDVVTAVDDTADAGQIPPDTTVLVGREEGADALRRLEPGERVRIGHRLTGPRHLWFALGGFPILRDGVAPPDLDPVSAAARTAAGVSRDGRRAYLVVVDGHTGASNGLTVADLATLLHRVGADDALNLDGGGSSTLAMRMPGERTARVRNTPSGSGERAVANGIGVFVR
jgi:hypothetical protein